MQILVIGATGRTGQTFLEQALAAGASVTAFVRSPEKLQNDNARLTVIAGDGREAKAVATAVTSADFTAILVLVGGSLSNDGTNQEITDNVIQAMRAKGSAARLWVLSACGTGDSYDQLNWFGKVLKKTLLRGPFADHEIQERSVRESGLPYTIVRPVGLTNGPLTENGYVAKESGKMPAAQISRADVAHYMLTHLEDATVKNKAVALSGK